MEISGCLHVPETRSSIFSRECDGKFCEWKSRYLEMPVDADLGYFGLLLAANS